MDKREIPNCPHCYSGWVSEGRIVYYPPPNWFCHSCGSFFESDKLKVPKNKK